MPTTFTLQRPANINYKIFSILAFFLSAIWNIFPPVVILIALRQIVSYLMHCHIQREPIMHLRHYYRHLALAALAFISLSSSGIFARQVARPATADAASQVALLKESMTDPDKFRNFYTAYSSLATLLESPQSAKAAETILAARNELVADTKVLDAISTKDARQTALRVLELARSYSNLKRFGKGRLVFGTIKIADNKLEPDLVLAQMVIQPDGWFCTEIADAAKPLSFRAAGYRMLDSKIPPDAGAANLGTLVMQPVTDAEMATIKGKIEFQGAAAGADFKATVNYSVPPPNTVTGGYSPRRRWPEPQPFSVQKDGSFEIKGLTPGSYAVSLNSSKHENYYKAYNLKSAETTDTGTIMMRTTDLAFYIGKPSPKAGKFPWEKDIAAARKRAQAENKPMMIMMTATWCGPCKMLEANTLSDGWVQQFMKDFVVVQAYEDKEVEKQYDGSAYPTLVFTDKTGKEVHRTLGYQPPIAFSGNILKARKELKLPEDADLKVLEEKKVVKPPVMMRRIGG
jgi:thiol-disulfide isomerase/thioredoxin